jgi:YYY domain-containing protein
MLGMLAGVYLLYLPFYLHFVPPLVRPGPNEPCIGSACFAIATTSLSEFLTVFGLLLFPPAVLVATRGAPRLPSSGEGRHLAYAVAGLAIVLAAIAGNAVLPLLALLLAGAVALAYGDGDEDAANERAGFLLIAAATIALLACEVAFLKDSYGEKLYRMNTVFKLYFQAWTILAIAAPWALARLLARAWRWAPAPRLIRLATALLIVMSACYPIGITLDRLNSPWKTLDGTAYLRRDHPDDYAAMAWLQANAADGAVIAEATGNPYSYFARFAANTGQPTILGWANHEGLWRGHDRTVMARREDVLRIYNAPTLLEVQALLDRYHVRYIVVGDLEREEHPPRGLDKFAELSEVFRSGQTVIYQR